MNTYNPDQHNMPPRFDIDESEIDEVDRPYLNYLEAAREPVSLEFWTRFSKIEVEFLVSLIEKYKIPIINGDPDKIIPLNILNTTSKKVNHEITVEYLAKWKQLKSNISQPKSDE